MLTLLQWNINGYNNNYIELEILIKTYKPSVILLNETHLAHNSYAPIPKPYVGHFHNLPHINTNKQGIAILVKRNLPHRYFPTPSNISSLSIELQTSSRFIITCAYSPPSQSITTADFYNLLPSPPQPFILAGDFNAWSPFWGSTSSNQRGRAIEDAILTSDCIVLNDGSPTHFSTHSTFTHIDLTLSSPSFSNNSSWSLIDDLHGSDHFPILIKIHTSRPTVPFSPRIKFKTDRADWNKFELACESYSNSFPLSFNINLETSNLHKAIRCAANASIPLSSTKPVKPAPLWWNKEIASLRQAKQHAWHYFKRNRSTSNLIQYRKLNAQFRRVIKDAKLHCFQKFTSSISASSDPKRIWADIKKLTGVPCNSQINSLNSSHGNLLYPWDIAQEFASHFSNASSDHTFPPEFITYKHSLIPQNRTTPSNLSYSARLLEADISLLELKLALSATKGQTPSIDKISYPMIKHLPLSVLHRLIKHYNNILTTGHYPHVWKTSAVIPLLKPGKSPCDVNSYRPISLLPCLGKLMEKIIATRLTWYAHSNKLIHPNQVAFKKGHGTTDALLHLDHFISNALSSKNHISLLSLDFQKAFDRIGIQVVLRQLDKWKIGPKLYNFIKSFLSNRKLRVLISNTRSPIFPLDNGTPQGSPLSVILFIIAFNEISTIFNKFPTIQHQIYADDVLLFSKSKDQAEVMRTFSKILRLLSTWSLFSGPSICPSKTKMLHICKKRECLPSSLTLYGVNIANTDNLKFLGIIFDPKYSFQQHCKYVREKLYVKLNIIKYLSSKRSLISSTLLINVVKALILSTINYGLAVYGLHAKQNLKMLAAPYHAAVRRSIRAFPTSPIKAILAESGLPSLYDNMEDKIFRLYPKLTLSLNLLICKDFQSATSRVSTPKILSSIHTCALFAKHAELPSKPHTLRYTNHPPWAVSKKSFINDLANLRKDNTPNAVYRAKFSESIADYKFNGWQLVFTDGSKGSHTSYAVVKENQEVIAYGLLFSFCSIFTAEATAILQAVQYCAKSKGKHIICSDSLSCFQAIQNHKKSSKIIDCIKNILITHRSSIKIMWIPGHSGIQGNTLADTIAKDISITPTVTSEVILPSDIFRLIHVQRQTKLLREWSYYKHHYSNINPKRTKPAYPSSVPTNYITPYTRLRIGHTIITSVHLLQGNTSNTCPFCQGTVSVHHLLVSCPELASQRHQHFSNTDPLLLLKDATEDNIKKIYKFLKDTDLLRRI